MTDPLFTIDEATRTFRTSSKTIRRRLAAGEIAGAYKRPGSRGPEWVMPERSLLDAGFAKRSAGPPSPLPDDPVERAAYWERRALGAEAAVAAGRVADPSRGRTNRRVSVLVVLSLVLVVLAFVAGRLTADGREVATRPADPTAVVRTMLAARTNPGGRIGLLGPVPSAAVPDGRDRVRLDGDPSSFDGTRYIVATAGDAAQRAELEDLDSSAELLLAVAAGADRSLYVYDTGAGPAVSVSKSGEDEDRPDADRATPVGEAGEPPPAPVPAPDEATVAPSDEVTPEEAAPAPPSATRITVRPGDSFWTIASDAVGSDGAAVAPYWSALVDLNMDRLVDPGNPDLLHVGQIVFLPPPA